MKIVRREVSKNRGIRNVIGLMFLHFLVALYTPIWYVIMILGSILWSFIWSIFYSTTNEGVNMRCLEWGLDFTVNGSRVTFHKAGTHRIEQRFEYKADDSSGKGI